MAKIKRNNRGFTIMELVVTISILGIVAATVAYIMVTSSKSYSSLSTEAKLQSEAQLVANAISEIAIDSYDAARVSSAGAVAGFDTTDGNVLELTSTVENVKKMYLFAIKNSTDELYLLERTYDASSSTWGAYTNYLLGNHISGFSVDDSRVANDNVLVFSIDYTKNNRTYKGNYQVLMRNKAYAKNNNNNPVGNAPAQILLGLNPKIVYLDVKDGRIEYYYINKVSDTNKKQASVGGVVTGVEFKSTATTIGGVDDANVTWDLQNADEEIFKMDQAVETVDNKLVWDPSKSEKLKNTGQDRFTLVISKVITDPITGADISAVPKTAQIILRRVTSIRVNATSGTTGWIDQYSSLYGGVKSSETNAYAYTNAAGDYEDLHLNAFITYNSVDYGGGLKWELQMKENDATGWVACNNETYAKLTQESTPTGTSNTVKFGPSAQNGQLYRVIATSIFDESVKSEPFVFGIAPSGNSSTVGFNGRAFYVNLSAYLKKTNLSDVSIANIEIGEVGEALDKGDIKLRKTNNKWYMYVGYDAFADSKRTEFFSNAQSIELKITKNTAEGSNSTADAGSVNYYLNPVTMSKISPQPSIIVLRKGADRDITVQTNYYNIIDRGHLGVYIDGVNVNEKSGMSDTNKYLKANVTSEYGDAENYVNRAILNLNAKSTIKDYCPEPISLRFTAEEFYAVSNGMDGSYTDYTVYVTNVEDSDVFIPTPDTKSSVGCVWPTGDGRRSISGYDANGNLVANIAQVYPDGNLYKCDFRGSTYTYNKTYHYWSK